MVFGCDRMGLFALSVICGVLRKSVSMLGGDMSTGVVDL